MSSIICLADAHRRLANPRGWRELVAHRLLQVGGRLIRWAWHLAPAPRQPMAEPLVEFSALGAGSSEHGALYVNGQLVGTLAGVRRL